MPEFIADNYDVGDTFTITLDTGETLENAEVVGKDSDPAQTSWERAWASLTIEGDWWEQVNDRVESGVLHVDQETNRGGGGWKPAEVSGAVWVGEPEEASEPDFKTIGTVTGVGDE